MNDELSEIAGATPDFRTELAEKLAELVPEAVADGKIDTKKLEELLNGDAADTRERFGLFWPGKKRALRAAQEPTTATLVPDKENSKDWDTTQNVFIEGDNLEVLKILQKHYHGKIKMIYIDPPYNTGQDFVYPDNYQEGLKSYLEFTQQVDEGGKRLSTNSDQAGRYHSNWLNMMYPRLKLARNLLTDDGFIFISIDDSEVDNLRKLCNEVFGEGHFVAQFIWKARKFSDARAKTNVSTDHEYVLAYSRTAQRSLRGVKRDESKFKNPDGDARGPWMSRSMLGLATRDQRPNLHYDLIDPATGTVYPPSPSTGWRYSRERMENLVAEGRVLFPSREDGRPREKKFRSEMQADYIAFRSVIDGVHTADGTEESRELLGGGVFPFPKPVGLVKTLIDQGSSADKEAIVLDFFAGSGTTAHAVMALNAEDGGSRKFIQVQLPEPVDPMSEAGQAGFKSISDISRQRIVRAAELIQGDEEKEIDGKLDLGFRSYALSDTNFAKWRLTSDVAESELEQHLLNLRESADDQASQEALLTELLLKRGYSLTEQVDVFDVAGLEIHGVKDAEGDYGLLAYLNEHQKPSLEQLRALVDEAEAQIVILEDAFQGDDQLKTNLAQLCKSKGIELWTA